MNEVDTRLKEAVRKLMGRESSSHHPSPFDLYSFRSGELAETPLHDEILEHVSHCKSCFDELEDIAALLEEKEEAADLSEAIATAPLSGAWCRRP